MLELQLFRIRIFPSTQGELFSQELTREEILNRVIRSLPQIETRKRSVWHIGNVSDIDANSLYFKLGRTTISTVEMYRDGNFVDEPFEVAPYTHVFLDSQLEIVAIAKKQRLSPKTTGIANAFIRLLNESNVSRQLHVRFEIDALSDPDEFVAQLSKAYSVTKFWFSFKRPNPIDVNKDYIKPMQLLLHESDGNEGKTELKGDTLKPEVLQDLTRSAAATGDNAGATIQFEQAGQKVRKSLRQNPVIISQDEVAEAEDKKGLLERMRSIYRRIRGKNNE
jgi:hypothetical protein